MTRIVALKTIQLISWKDVITFRNIIDKPFDSISVRWMTWKTDSQQLETLSIRILNLDSNIGQLQLADGSTRDYTKLIYLDPSAEVTVFQEFQDPPIDLGRMMNTYGQFRYEIYIDGESGYGGISVNNPVNLEIAFLKY